MKVLERLRQFGVKPSLQRMAILEYLMDHPIHPTADMIFNEVYPSIPTLSKTTVYNTLSLLTEHGAIQSINIDEKNVRYDADISSHAHFKCKNCGSIHDLIVEGLERVDVKNIGNHTITGCHLYYMGYCEKCKDEIKKDIN